VSQATDTTEILKAGGLVPVGAKLGEDDAVDTVVARAYRHAVLPGRTVVRLTAQSVATGDDLEMATLGFGAGEDRGVVGQERRRPLGFPGWALVHDPKNARFALDVVKEFKKHARKAKSKPGHAKDGIDAIAEKLARSVPHFLPSFYEEAGRAFIEHGATTFAATCFGKAREAEAVHSLEVDEEHRVHGFLEFALAGAVTTKALTQYAKDLADHHEPKVAYAHFRQLCLQRTLGGVPPWSGMAKELRRLAKAAKLDPDREDAAFIAEIVESPALGKAAGEFWRAYAAPITALGKENPSVRGALLNLFPTGSAHSPELDEIWLDLLEATGATQALVSDDAPEAARASGGRAAWFDKLTAHLARSWRNSTISGRAFGLLRRMAPMLIADARPITCAGRYHRIDLDLCELALELGVPVAPPAEHPRLDVEEWAKHATEPERGRDPIRAAAHPAIGPLLADSVASELGDEPFDTMSRGKAGFLAAKRAWLERTIAKAEQGALPALVDAITTIESKVKPETFAELPDLHARFAAVDAAPALARTLRIGIVDELGWPLLEEVAAELSPDGKAELSFHGGPPALVVATKTRAIAIGPAGRLGEHDLVLPPKHELITARWIGGQFLVVLKEGYKTRAYWSAAPHDVFESDLSTWYLPKTVGRVVVFPDGAWLEGDVPMRPGERKLSLGGKVTAFDGTTAWINDPKDGQTRWREITASGEQGRHSWPSFIEAGLETDWKLDNASYVMPAPAAASPLGVAGGLVGVRIRFQNTGTNRWAQTRREVEMIDGTAWTGEVNVHMTCLARLPGGGEPRPLMEETAWRQGTTTTILSPDGKLRGSRINDSDRRYFRGQVTAISPGFWHLLSPRDEAGSRRLREVTDADARALIAAVPVQQPPPPTTTPTPPIVAEPPLADVTGGVLAEVSHPRLQAGVTGLAVLAAELERQRDRLVAERAPDQATKPASATGHNDDVLLAGLAGLCERQWSKDGRAWAQIERTGEVFASDDRSDRTIKQLPGAALDWFAYACAPGALAFMALAVGTPAAKRRPIGDLLQQLVTALPPPDTLRVYDAHRPQPVEGSADAGLDAFELRWAGGNAYALRRIGWQPTHARVLEYAPDGVFKPLPGWTPEAVTAGGRAVPPAQVADVLAAIAEGKTSWSADAAGKLAAATGLTPSEGVYLWAGCPNATDRNANFLDKELREKTLGLKAKQAEVARDSLVALPLAKRIRALAAAGDAGVAALLEGTAVDALIEAWKQAFGERVAIPEELIAEADRELWAPMQPNPALRLIASPDDSPVLAVDGTWALDDKCDVVRVANAEPLVGQTKLEEPPPAFGIQALQTVAIYLPFVFAELPVGHPLRASAARAHELVLARLANPALWFEAGSHYMTEDDAKAMDRVIDGLGGELLTGFAEGTTARRLPGAVVQRTGTRVELKLHPATLDARAVATIGKLAQQITQWGLGAWKAIEFARSEDLAAIAARIRATPVPAGQWEQNPLLAAPAVVDRVVAARGLSREAAALYLQYLVLLWPTAKNLSSWNGWKPKQLEAATAELVAQELVLEAKRERAQRTYFLPGGWEALKAPNPPMETWKLPLYGTRTAEGDPDAPLVRFQALAPFHVLFERAWQRVEGGDVPRYEEVKR
jgi:hypothetical protein